MCCEARKMEIGESLDDQMDLAFLPRATQNGQRPHYNLFGCFYQYSIPPEDYDELPLRLGVTLLIRLLSLERRSLLSFSPLLQLLAHASSLLCVVKILGCVPPSFVHVLRTEYSNAPGHSALRSFCSFVFLSLPINPPTQRPLHRRKGVNMAWC